MIPTFMDYFEGFKTSVKEVTADGRKRTTIRSGTWR